MFAVQTICLLYLMLAGRSCIQLRHVDVVAGALHGPRLRFTKLGGVSLVPLEIDCHVHRGVVAGLAGSDANNLRGEPALIPLRVHP